MNNDLISRKALKKATRELYKETPDGIVKYGIEKVYDLIYNAPTVEAPENGVNCVLTVFGTCSYNETGCSDCEIRNKILKALNERPQGEWIKINSLGNGNAQYMCSNCYHGDDQAESQEVPYCWHCGAKMMKEGVQNEQ